MKKLEQHARQPAGGQCGEPRKPFSRSGTCPIEVDMAADLKELTDRLVAFRDERDWRQFHGIKNLIASIGVEAGELLELVQWLDDAGAEAALADAGFRQRLAEECADVLLYLLLACERAGVDLGQAALTKIAANAEKYPVEKARGSARKYTDS